MKKFFAVTAMVLSLVMVLIGILAISGEFGSAGSYGETSSYDSGFASFGADYYTYSVNNTAETASAARATASNLREISDLLEGCFGWFMILFGLLSFCGFGIVLGSCLRPVSATEMPDPEISSEEETKEEVVETAEGKAEEEAPEPTEESVEEPPAESTAETL